MLADIRYRGLRVGRRIWEGAMLSIVMPAENRNRGCQCSYRREGAGWGPGSSMLLACTKVTRTGTKGGLGLIVDDAVGRPGINSENLRGLCGSWTGADLFQGLTEPGDGGRLATLLLGWVLASCLLTMGAPSAASAQDSHHWNIQYGNRSRLLGGAAVGSASDLSAVYYNPGRLALVERPELLLSGTVFELTKTHLAEREGPRTLTSSRFALSPSLIAGELRFGFLGKSRLAYSFLTRQLSAFDLQGSLTDAGPAIFGLPSRGSVTDSVRLEHRLTESWGGLTWAYQVGERLGVGVSTFVASRNQRGFSQRTLTTVFDDGASGLVLQTNDYKYSHWRIVWKLGVGTRLEGWDLGATLTLPGVSLGGSGRLAVDNVWIGNKGFAETVLSNGQEGLDSRFESPWSLAAGGSRSFGKSRIHMTLEWFAPQDSYAVIEARQVGLASGGDALDPSIRQQAGSVTNAAIGFEHRFGPEVTGYTSLSSDRSSAVEGGVSNLAFTQWNILHASAGATFSKGTTDLTLGLVGAFGTSRATPRLMAEDFDSSYRRLTLILGFSFPFGLS